MKILVALLAGLVALSGVTVKLKPKEEPTIVSETPNGSCTEYVIENRVPAHVVISFSCGTDFDAPELPMDAHTRLTVDMCDSREKAPSPHCFITTWEKK